MGAWARAGCRVWDLGNGTIMLQKLLNPESQITSKSFLLSSFLIGFPFSPTAEISRFKTWVWRKFAAENRVNFQIGHWTGVKWSSQSRKTNFLTLPNLAFGFVHKRSGNEITKYLWKGTKDYQNNRSFREFYFSVKRNYYIRFCLLDILLAANDQSWGKSCGTLYFMRAASGGHLRFENSKKVQLF